MDYKYLSASGWQTGPSYSSGDAGYFNCLAIGDDGTMHLSNQQRGGVGDLYYLTRDPADSGWAALSVDEPGDVGTTSFLVLDSDGHPHISYNDYSNSNLKYAWRTDSGWTSEIVAPMGRSEYSYQANFSSLALDDAGFPHIVFTSYSGGDPDDLNYAYKDGEGWHVMALDSEGSVGNYLSMTQDSTGGLHVAYADATNGSLKYMHKGESGWGAPEVVDADRAGYYTSIEVDSSDRPVIAYGGAGFVRVAVKRDGAWSMESADPAGSYAGYVDLAIDPDDWIHLAYRYTGTRLRYSTGPVPGSVIAPVEIISFAREETRVLISWSGPEGRDHVVYSSPDLQTWSELTRVPNAPATNDLIIPLTASERDTFYRIDTEAATPAADH